MDSILMSFSTHESTRRHKVCAGSVRIATVLEQTTLSMKKIIVSRLEKGQLTRGIAMNAGGELLLTRAWASVKVRLHLSHDFTNMQEHAMERRL